MSPQSSVPRPAWVPNEQPGDESRPRPTQRVGERDTPSSLSQRNPPVKGVLEKILNALFKQWLNDSEKA